MSLPYHEGELSVQARAGAFDQAFQNARVIRSHLPPPLARFLSTQSWIVLGAADEHGAVWSSLISGPPGFATAADDQCVRITAVPPPGDPLYQVATQADGHPVGLLAIDLSRRMRARINGTLDRDDETLVVAVHQAYPNCMKYIQRRRIEPNLDTHMPDATYSPAAAGPLSDEQAAIVTAADTAFIATLGPDGSADASHRGGLPGFLTYDPALGTIQMPNFPGNGMFNTLGNLELDPRAGLSIADFTTGQLLQITGRATARNARPDDLTLTLHIDQVHFGDGASPTSAGPVEYSPFLDTT